MKHQQTKCRKTGKVFDFKTAYGDDYKGIFRVRNKSVLTKKSDSNFFKNKYLENRLQKIYKKGGIDRQEEMPTYTQLKHKPM